MAAPFSSPAASTSTASQQFPPPSTPYQPTPLVRKRRADSPPRSQTPTRNGQPSKRRRPNLQTGFATMSISPGGTNTPTFQDNDYGFDDSDENEPSDGVHVQYLPDKPISPARVRRPRFPAKQRTSSFSSTSPSDDGYDSDAIFRIPHERARLQQLHETAQLPSEIEHPVDADHSQGPLVEPIDSPVKRKHLNVEDEQGVNEDGRFNNGDGRFPPSLKRQRSGMPDTMDMDGAGDMANVDSGPGWYEPEKDRIVITSLSSPERSRSPSPDRGPRRSDAKYSYAEHKYLAQPGDGGFTISPSLLTHIINAQKENPVPMRLPERGLVLYRPVGPPGTGKEDIVQQWDGEYTDSGRFEIIDDDETMEEEPEVSMNEPVAEQWSGSTFGAGTDMATEVPPGSADADGDVAMDMD